MESEEFKEYIIDDKIKILLLCIIHDLVNLINLNMYHLVSQFVVLNFLFLFNIFYNFSVNCKGFS